LPPLPWCVDKILLREASQDLLPEPVLRRPKAPWAEDPVLELVRRPEARWVDEFVPDPRLNDYVDRRAILTLTKENYFLKVWTNIRPLSLNYFLEGTS